MFFAMLIGVAILLAGSVTLRITGCWNLSSAIRLMIMAGLVLVFLSPFLLRGITGLGERIGYWLTYGAYFLFVCLFLFFCLMIIRDILWGILHHFYPEKIPSLFQKVAVLRANLYVLFIVVLLAGYSLFEGVRVPVVKSVTITSDKIKEQLSVVVLSDLHLHKVLSLNKVKGIVKSVNQLKPDVIIIPGDVIDDTPEAIAELMEELSDLKAPLGIFVTDGNHEFYMGLKMVQTQFKKNNWIYLNNDSRLIRSDIRIAGVPDMQGVKFGNGPDLKNTLQGEKVFTILSAHSPTIFDMPNNTADLQVSGHTHGGQIFPFHILVKMANRYLSGLYQKDNRFLYVSRGSGQWGPQMRLGAPAEISVIRIKPENQRVGG